MEKPRYLTINPGEIPTRELHQYLLGSVSPRPIAFASTVGPDGTPNLAPYSFFNVFSANPPTLIFSPARRVRDNTTKHTLENIYRNPEVVINVVSHAIVEQMSLASTEYPEGVNEFVKAGLTEVPSELIAPPRVQESPVQMECRVVEIKPLGDHRGAGNLIICRVLRMHINKKVLGGDKAIDPHLIDLVARMGKNYYSRASGEAVFEVEKPLTTLGIGIDALPESIRLSHILTGNDLGQLGNLERLPSMKEIASFKAKEGATLLKGIANKDDLHHKAQKLLRVGRRLEAMLLLYSY